MQKVKGHAGHVHNERQTSSLQLMHLTKKEVSIIVILLFIALVRFFFFLPQPPDYSRVVGEKVSVTGVVINAPDVRLSNQRITIRPDRQETNILVVLPKEFDVEYGDKIIAKGRLKSLRIS